MMDHSDQPADLTKRFEKIAKMQFDGARFREHALPVAALREISDFQAVVSKTARALWRDSHPDERELPKGFEERTQLYVTGVKPGSAIVPLALNVSFGAQLQLLGDCDGQLLSHSGTRRVKQAIKGTLDAIRTYGKQSGLPQRVHVDLLNDWSRLGSRLQKGETLAITDNSDDSVVINLDTMINLRQGSAEARFDNVVVEGLVYEVNLRKMQFRMESESGDTYRVPFREDHVITVVTAMRDWSLCRLRASGQAKFLRYAREWVFDDTPKLDWTQTRSPGMDPNRPRPSEISDAISATVPGEVWNNVPTDLSSSYKDYIFDQNDDNAAG